MRHRFWIVLSYLVWFTLQPHASQSAALFFGSNNSDSVGRIESATGTVTMFPGLGSAAAVSALTFAAGGRLWANTTLGVGEIDTQTGSFAMLVDPATVAAPDGSFPGFSVYSLAAGAGSLFFGDQDRIGRIDVSTGDVTLFPSLGLLGDVDALTFDASGRLWGNVSGAGVGEFDTATGSFSVLADPATVENPDVGGTPGFSVYSLAAGAGGLFFGEGDRIARIDVSTGDVTFFSPLGLVGDVNALSFDAAGRLWGNVTGTGIGEFDPSTGSFSLLVDPTTIIDPNTGMSVSPADVLAASPVPEPSSVLLVSAAAVGLIGFVRRAT